MSKVNSVYQQFAQPTNKNNNAMNTEPLFEQLHNAITQKNTEQAKSILQQIPAHQIVNGGIVYGYPYFPLAAAVKSNNLQLVQHLIQQYQTPITTIYTFRFQNLYAADIRNLDAIGWAIASKCDMALLHYLLQTVNAQQVNVQRFSMIKYDSQASMAPSMPTPFAAATPVAANIYLYHMTYLHVAAHYKNCDAIQWLMQHGADATVHCAKTEQGAMDGPAPVDMFTCGLLQGKACSCAK